MEKINPMEYDTYESTLDSLFDTLETGIGARSVVGHYSDYADDLDWD